MAVEREQYGVSHLRRVSGTHMPEVVKVTRQSNGDWGFDFRISGEAELPDGRVIEVNRRVRVRANCQIGRRQMTA